MIMSDTGDDSTVALAEMQSMMKVFQEELKTLKSGVTSVGTNLLEAGTTQPPVASGGIQSSGSLSSRSGEIGQRKRGQETDKEDDLRPDDDLLEDPDEDFSMDETENFPLSEAGNAFLETAFGSKCMDKDTYQKHVKKYGIPDSRWSKCPELDAVVAANLPKDTVRADLKAKRLQSYWLSAAAPLTAGLKDIEDGKCDLQDAARAMQAVLLFLGNASQ